MAGLRLQGSRARFFDLDAVRSRGGLAIRVSFVLVLLLLAGCAAPSPGVAPAARVSSPLAEPALYANMTHFVADVPVNATGDTVHVDYWLPSQPTGGASEKGPFPVVADVSPYYDAYPLDDQRRPVVPGYVTDWVLHKMVPRGFAFAAVDLPGTAGSTGCWDFMGPREVAATEAGVEWLGTQSWSNGRVATIGLSYDGMTQVMALARRPAHLVAAVPESPLTSAYDGVYVNGVPVLAFWGAAPADYEIISGTSPPTGEPERMPAWAERQSAQKDCAPDNFGQGVADLGQYNDYYRARDFVASAANVTIPVFYTQGFDDHNVLPDNLVPYAAALGGEKTVWLGQWIHTIPSARASGRTDFFVSFDRFLESALLPGSNATRLAPGFEVQDSLGRWRHEPTWPPQDATPARLALADGALAAGGTPGKGAQFVDDANAAATAGAPMDDPLPASVLYRGAPLAADLWISGVPRVELNVSVSGTRGQLVAELQDCAATCTTFTRGALNLLQRDGLDKSEPVPPNAIVRASFDLFPQDYVVEAGHSLALRVSSSDGDYFQPDPSRDVVTISESSSSPSTLTLPTIQRGAAVFEMTQCGVWLKDKPCYDANRKDEGR